MGSLNYWAHMVGVTASSFQMFRTPVSQVFNTDPYQGSGGHGGNRKPQPNRKNRRKRSKVQRAARRANR